MTGVERKNEVVRREKSMKSWRDKSLMERDKSGKKKMWRNGRQGNKQTVRPRKKEGMEIRRREKEGVTPEDDPIIVRNTPHTAKKKARQEALHMISKSSSSQDKKATQSRHEKNVHFQ